MTENKIDVDFNVWYPLFGNLYKYYIYLVSSQKYISMVLSFYFLSVYIYMYVCVCVCVCVCVVNLCECATELEHIFVDIL